MTLLLDRIVSIVNFVFVANVINLKVMITAFVPAFFLYPNCRFSKC